YDPPGLPLTFIKLTNPTHGSLGAITQLNPTQASVTYTPNSGYEGTDSFTFKVNNGYLDSDPSNPGIISITVGYQPVANSQVVQACRNTALPITLTGFDGCGDNLTFFVVTPPTYGSLGVITSIDGTSASVTYTPLTSTFCGEDSFTFKVNDGVRDSDAASITINVGDPNPLAQCGDVMTGKNTPVTITLSGSDTCTDTLTFAAVTGSGPIYGTLGTITQIDATHASVTYTPGTSAFEGTDGFDFMVSNCRVSSSSAHVTINVVPAPVLTASCREDRIFLGWTIPEWVKLAGLANEFQIYRCNTSSGSCSPVTLLTTASGTAVAHMDTDLVANMNYCYKVSFRHQNTCDSAIIYESPFSNIACSSIVPHHRHQTASFVPGLIRRSLSEMMTIKE
ncbi:MAG: Ig-like domain-containing protein, partial [Limisphaerales bacterium]